eukprot:m51a1_g4090 hypothetical protein (411) ;mRNA; r:56755-61839
MIALVVALLAVSAVPGSGAQVDECTGLGSELYDAVDDPATEFTRVCFGLGAKPLPLAPPLPFSVLVHGTVSLYAVSIRARDGVMEPVAWDQGVFVGVQYWNCDYQVSLMGVKTADGSGRLNYYNEAREWHRADDTDVVAAKFNDGVCDCGCGTGDIDCNAHFGKVNNCKDGELRKARNGPRKLNVPVEMITPPAFSAVDANAQSLDRTFDGMSYLNAAVGPAGSSSWGPTASFVQPSMTMTQDVLAATEVANHIVVSQGLVTVDSPAAAVSMGTGVDVREEDDDDCTGLGSEIHDDAEAPLSQLNGFSFKSTLFTPPQVPWKITKVCVSLAILQVPHNVSEPFSIELHGTVGVYPVRLIREQAWLEPGERLSHMGFAKRVLYRPHEPRRATRDIGRLDYKWFSVDDVETV